ncbi:MAG: cytochrome c3 family protein, partial [Pirellulaceae bacterium]
TTLSRLIRVAKYPAIRETQLNSCWACHMPNVKEFLNGYGLALKESKMDFETIEAEDSDKDGVTNIEEIQNDRSPGSHATFPEYFIFHVNFSSEDSELGKVHFNHEMHTIKESFLSKGRCSNCHGKDLFPKKFDDTVSVRPLAHQICWRCHETSGSKLAPRDCTQCHTGIEGMVENLRNLLK